MLQLEKMWADSANACERDAYGAASLEKLQRTEIMSLIVINVNLKRISDETQFSTPKSAVLVFQLPSCIVVINNGRAAVIPINRPSPLRNY